jgi:hypothetical protein
MSPKGFLHKASGKVSAGAFLAQHKEWLTTGELAAKTSPILAKLEAGELLASPALDEIRNVVLAHHLEAEVRKGEEQMAKAEAKEAGGGSSKPYLATILDSEGNIPEEYVEKTDPDTGAVTGEWKSLQKAFDLPQRAEGWLDRKLFDGAVDWHGEVASTLMTGKDGLPITTQVSRAEAIARILKRPKGAVMNVRGQSTSRLGFGVKSKPDRNVRSNMG